MSREAEVDILIVGSGGRYDEDVLNYIKTVAEVNDLAAKSFVIQADALGYLQSHTGMKCVTLYHNESDEQTANMIGEIRKMSLDLRICVVSPVMPDRAYNQRLEEISRGGLSVIDATHVQLNTLFGSLRLNPSS